MKKATKKVPKRKPKYGLFSCVGYIYRLLWQSERKLVFSGILTVPVSLALSALTLYTPSIMLSALEKSGRFSQAALVIIGLLFAQLLCSISDNVITTKSFYMEMYVLNHMKLRWETYLRDRDRYLGYDPEVQKWNERAQNASGDNHTAGVHFPKYFTDMLSEILKFLLFGTVISLLHPLIILLLAAGCALNAVMGKWERRRNWEERCPQRP